MEDLRIGAELATTAVFDAVRGLIRKVLFMPEKHIFSPLGFDGRETGWVDDSEVTLKTSWRRHNLNSGTLYSNVVIATRLQQTCHVGHWTCVTTRRFCWAGGCCLCQQFHVVHGVQGYDSPQRPLGGPRLRRTNSFSDWESLHNVWTAAEVIKAAGYPLEQHTVTTSDGYILRMERLPRHGTALLALQSPKPYMLHSLQAAL